MIVSLEYLGTNTYNSYAMCLGDMLTKKLQTIAIKIMTIVRKLWEIKIIKLRLRNSDNKYPVVLLR